jgi:hypothetical protein
MWSEADLSAALTDRLNLTIPLVARNSFSLADPQLAGGGPILDFRVNQYVGLSGGYLFVSLPNTGKGYNVNVPLASATVHSSIKRVRFSDRNRFEKLFGLPGSPARYRNKVTIDLPLASGRWTPFLSNEIFYDFSQRAWTQNRFQIGIGRRLTPTLKLDTYFLERSDLRVSNNNVHAIGLTLEVSARGTSSSVGNQHGRN